MKFKDKTIYDIIRLNTNNNGKDTGITNMHHYKIDNINNAPRKIHSTKVRENDKLR